MDRVSPAARRPEARRSTVVSLFEHAARRAAGSRGAAQAQAPLAARGSVRTLAVTSGKGGVGKTVVTANLAVALARRGLRVLLIDADLGLANVDTLFGLQPRATLRQVVAGDCTLEDVVLEGPAGIAVVPASSGFADMARLADPSVAWLVDRLGDFARGFDVALVDTAAGISPAVLDFVRAADEKLVVVTPEPTSLTDAYAMIKVLATRHGERGVDVLVNQARSEPEAARSYAQLRAVSERFLALAPRLCGVLPYDPEVREAIRRQQPLFALAPRAPMSLALDALSKALVERWRHAMQDPGAGAQERRR